MPLFLALSNRERCENETKYTCISVVSLKCLQTEHHIKDAVMPLFDHFHPPLYPHHHWESFHSNWATRIADGIAAVLPPEFQVEEHTHAGPGFEIDVATLEREAAVEEAPTTGSLLAPCAAPAYAPPTPEHIIPAAFPDTFEVRVFNTA